MTVTFRATGPLFSAESASMNASQTQSRQSLNMSGALRYERVAILEAALTIKEQRQRQWWTRVLATVGVIAVTAVGFALAAT